MNLNKEYRDPERIKRVLDNIYKLVNQPVTLMEVCGTHTMAIFRHGIGQILPEEIKLLSGPGCPVCVTSHKAIDEGIELALKPNVIFTTFGDMIRVPGSRESLAQTKARGADVRIVYSPLEAVELAKNNPDKEVVFFAIGFETTSPTIAISVITAQELNLDNFSIIGSHKTIPHALRTLLSSKEIKIDGLICPGHVSAIIGKKPYEFVAEEFHIPSVITGLEPLDILQGIYMILKQLKTGKPLVEIQYKRGVPEEGNPHALKMLYQVFESTDDYWRGIGIIPGTGLGLKKDYQRFDAKAKFNIHVSEVAEPKGCRCGEVLRGVITPQDCGLFRKVCTPEKPVGACMVSVEGTCAAYYKYGMRETWRIEFFWPTAVGGARPLYLSAGFIIEEGFSISTLKEIVNSMKEAAGVQIVTGDTKVVEKGHGDGVYINTAGIGVIPDEINLSATNAQPGIVFFLVAISAIMVRAVMAAREFGS